MEIVGAAKVELCKLTPSVEAKEDPTVRLEIWMPFSPSREDLTIITGSLAAGILLPSRETRSAVIWLFSM